MAKKKKDKKRKKPSQAVETDAAVLAVFEKYAGEILQNPFVLDKSGLECSYNTITNSIRRLKTEGVNIVRKFGFNGDSGNVYYANETFEAAKHSIASTEAWVKDGISRFRSAVVESINNDHKRHLLIEKGDEDAMEAQRKIKSLQMGRKLMELE